MLISSIVTFKGNSDGLTIVLKEAPFEKILAEITNKISKNKKFFAVDSLKITFTGRELSDEEKASIVNLIKEKTGIHVQVSEMVNKETTGKSNLKVKAYNSGLNFEQMQIYPFCEGKTKFYQGTLRSGQRISFEGNVVILGDINAGSEVVCSGNVIAFGCIKGVVHAGASGDMKAVVAALDLQPVQLRIANIITRSPDEQVKGFNPEIAYIKDNSIFIEAIDTRVKI